MAGTALALRCPQGFRALFVILLAPERLLSGHRIIIPVALSGCCVCALAFLWLCARASQVLGFLRRDSRTIKHELCEKVISVKQECGHVGACS